MLAAPTRLTQRQLAQAAHLVAARGMWAPLSLAARARCLLLSRLRAVAEPAAARQPAGRRHEGR